MHRHLNVKKSSLFTGPTQAIKSTGYQRMAETMRQMDDNSLERIVIK